ncbi:hypothetical protein BX257_5169 [Streptomyces sp. 3212.3]|nr:hypothetical protein BX257_5169 [Streptomyces sp. 3212.3]
MRCGVRKTEQVTGVVGGLVAGALTGSSLQVNGPRPG